MKINKNRQISKKLNKIWKFLNELKTKFNRFYKKKKWIATRKDRIQNSRNDLIFELFGIEKRHWSFTNAEKKYSHWCCVSSILSRRLLNEYREPFNRATSGNKKKKRVNITLSLCLYLYLTLCDASCSHNYERIKTDITLNILFPISVYLSVYSVSVHCIEIVWSGCIGQSKLHKSVLELAHTNAVGK